MLLAEKLRKPTQTGGYGMWLDLQNSQRLLRVARLSSDVHVAIASLRGCREYAARTVSSCVNSVILARTMGAQQAACCAFPLVWEQASSPTWHPRDDASANRMVQNVVHQLTGLLLGWKPRVMQAKREHGDRLHSIPKSDVLGVNSVRV